MINKSQIRSVHVYLFLRLAAQICSTLMMSCVQFEKIKDKSFRTGIWEGGERRVVWERRLREVFKVGVLYSVVI